MPKGESTGHSNNGRVTLYEFRRFRLLTSITVLGNRIITSHECRPPTHRCFKTDHQIQLDRSLWPERGLFSSPMTPYTKRVWKIPKHNWILYISKRAASIDKAIRQKEHYCYTPLPRNLRHNPMMYFLLSLYAQFTEKYFASIHYWFPLSFSDLFVCHILFIPLPKRLFWLYFAVERKFHGLSSNVAHPTTVWLP